MQSSNYGNYQNSTTGLPSYSFGVYDQPEPQLVLKHEKEWQKFDIHTNEMKIGNYGKEFCPSLQFDVVNVDPTAKFRIGLKLKRLNNTGMMDYSQKGWSENENGLKDGIPMYSNEVLTSVESGFELMKTGYKAGKMFNVGYYKKKIKNNEKGVTLTTEDIERKQKEQWVELKKQRETQAEVFTRCSYQPIVTLYQILDNGILQIVTSSQPSVTKFIAVSDIKNETIKDMRAADNRCVRRDFQKKAVDRMAGKTGEIATVSEKKIERKRRQEMRSANSTGTPSPTSTNSGSPASTINSDLHSPPNWDNFGVYNNYNQYSGFTYPMYPQYPYGGYGGWNDFNQQFQTNWGGVTGFHNDYANQQSSSAHYPNYQGGFDSFGYQNVADPMNSPSTSSSTSAIVSDPVDMPKLSEKDFGDMKCLCSDLGTIEEMIIKYN